jgi:hypothetical protein
MLMRDWDIVSVRTLLSAAGALSLINLPRSSLFCIFFLFVCFCFRELLCGRDIRELLCGMCHLFAFGCVICLLLLACVYTNNTGSHSLSHSLSLLNSTFTAYNMHDTLNSSYNIHECSSVMLLCLSLVSFPAPAYNAAR